MNGLARALLLVSLCGVAATAWAADPSFDVGDRVEYEHRGEWLPAKVVERLSDRMYRIRLDDPQVRPQERGALARKLRPVSGTAARPANPHKGEPPQVEEQAQTPSPASIDLAAVAKSLPARKTGWGLPRPRVAPTPLRAPRTPIRLKGGSNGFFEQPDAVCLAPAVERAVVAHVDKRPGDDAQVTVEVINLDGRPGDTLEASGELLDVSADGEVLLLLRKTATGTFTAAWVFSAEPLNRNRAGALKPLSVSAQMSSRLHLARLIDNDQLLVHIDEVLALWSLRQGEVVWAYTLAPTARPTLTPDRQLACFAVGGADPRLIALELATGELVMSVTPPARGTVPGRVVASPDPGRLLLLHGREVIAVDAGGGTLLSRGEVASYSPEAEITWLDEACVLFGASAVYDTTRGLPLARIHPFPDGKSVAEGGVVWYAQRRGRREPPTFGGYAVDVAALRQLPEKPAGDALWSVEPGTQMALQASGDEATAIRPAVERTLTQAGYRVVDHADIVATATISRENGETVEYEGFGLSRGNDQTVTQRIVIYDLAIRRGGEMLLQRTIRDTFGGLSIERIEDGKSLQQSIDERAQPSPDRFGEMYIPERILNPKYANGFTTLRLDEQ